MPSDVVSFGETMLRFSPAYNSRLEEAKTFNMYVAGSESNTLACLARLNLKVTWVSALPLNPMGRHVDAELRRYGVDTASVVWLGDKVRLGIFYSEEAPNPLGLQVYYDRTYSACALVDPGAIDYSVVNDARILHLTGITPALSDNVREVFRRFLQRADEKNVPLSFDVNYRSKLWSIDEAVTGIEEACRQASLLFCTRTDAAELWGFSGTPEFVLRKMAQRFAENNTNKTIVLTLGSEGAAQFQNGEYSIEPIFPTEGTVRFGSGDAFAAGYLYAYLEEQYNHDLRKERGITPLVFGNALAALKRCIAGDIANITLQELWALLYKQERIRFR